MVKYTKNVLVTKNYKTQKTIHALKVGILFYSRINMKIKFQFNIITLKDENFHVDLIKYILQNFIYS
jgi:hypothetical protein